MLMSIASLSLARRERPIALGDLRIPLRPQMPDRGGIFDQERESRACRAAAARAASAPMSVPHAGIEAIVHMGQNEVEMRASTRIVSSSPSHSSCMRLREAGPVFEETRSERHPPWFGEEVERIEASRDARNSRRTSSFIGRERGGIRGAFERFEVQLGEIDAVPIEALIKALSNADRHGAEAIRIGEVHQLAPVEVRVLQERRSSRAIRDGPCQNFSLTCGSSSQA